MLEKRTISAPGPPCSTRTPALRAENAAFSIASRPLGRDVVGRLLVAQARDPDPAVGGQLTLGTEGALDARRPRVRRRPASARPRSRRASPSACRRGPGRPAGRCRPWPPGSAGRAGRRRAGSRSRAGGSSRSPWCRRSPRRPAGRRRRRSRRRRSASGAGCTGGPGGRSGRRGRCRACAPTACNQIDESGVHFGVAAGQRRGIATRSPAPISRWTRAGDPTATTPAGRSRVDHCARPDDGVPPDRHPGADDHPSAQPDVVLEGDRVHGLPAGAPDLRVDGVRGGQQLHVGGQLAASADGDRRAVEHDAAGVDEGARADADAVPDTRRSAAGGSRRRRPTSPISSRSTTPRASRSAWGSALKRSTTSWARA